MEIQKRMVLTVELEFTSASLLCGAQMRKLDAGPKPGPLVRSPEHCHFRVSLTARLPENLNDRGAGYSTPLNRAHILLDAVWEPK
jgi:hypothetical protein